MRQVRALDCGGGVTSREAGHRASVRINTVVGVGVVFMTGVFGSGVRRPSVAGAVLGLAVAMSVAVAVRAPEARADEDLFDDKGPEVSWSVPDGVTSNDAVAADGGDGTGPGGPNSGGFDGGNGGAAGPGGPNDGGGEGGNGGTGGLFGGGASGTTGPSGTISQPAIYGWRFLDWLFAPRSAPQS